MTEDRPIYGTLSRRAGIGLVIGASALMLMALVGIGRAFVAALLVVLIEGVAAAGVVIAAGGYGMPIVRALTKGRGPAALRVVTACALGLWMLSVLMLLVGTAFGGLLKPWLWWPVVGVGVALAAWQGRKKIEAWRFPDQFDGRVLTWVIIAAAIGVWLGGVTNAPGLWPGLDETFEELERHLQIPREYYNAQRIVPLRHNCYSYHPLGVEMLFLLAMAMRGGAYEGVYLAKMLHGAFAVLAVAGVFAALKDEDDMRARFAAVMLATAPFVLCLSWLGLVGLAPLCYATLSLLWLRQWLHEKSSAAALLVGLMAGGACATRYLSFALVAAPIVTVMLVYRILRPRLVWHVGVAAFAVALPVLPWLIRNTAYTGNPVFPLATEFMGRAHWSRESQQRWANAHSVPPGPPVPRPDAWRGGPELPRAEMLYHNFVAYRSSQWFGLVVMLTAAAALCALAATTGTGAWNWMLAGVVVVQVGIWALVTPRMSPRLLVPVLAPICLMAAWVLSRLASARTNPLRRGSSTPSGSPWGLRPAVVIAALAVTVNLVIGYNVYKWAARGVPPAPGIAGRLVAESFWPDRGSRVLLIGERRIFYFPQGSVYATSFDTHVLADMADRSLAPRRVFQDLRSLGITHIFVNWYELWRLASTSGYPASLSAELYSRAQEGRGPGLEVLESLKELGVQVEQEVASRKPTTSSAPSTTPTTLPVDGQGWRPENFPRHWSMFTIYRLP